MRVLLVCLFAAVFAWAFQRASSDLYTVALVRSEAIDKATLDYLHAFEVTTTASKEKKVVWARCRQNEVRDLGLYRGTLIVRGITDVAESACIMDVATGASQLILHNGMARSEDGRYLVFHEFSPPYGTAPPGPQSIRIYDLDLPVVELPETDLWVLDATLIGHPATVRGRGTIEYRPAPNARWVRLEVPIPERSGR